MKQAQRPRVAVIGTRGYPSFYGGFETLLRSLIPYLAAHDWNVDVYCRPEVDRLPTSEQPEIDGVRQLFTSGIETKKLSTLSYGFTSTIKVISSRCERPEAALIMNVANGFWIPLLRLRGIPTVVNVDGIEWERAKWGRLAKAAFRLGAQLTATYATDLVFDSKHIAKIWESQFSRSGNFIPYGATESFEVLHDTKFAKGTYVLYVARLVPENSIEPFIDAATTISRHHPVVVVGSSGYGGEVEKRLESIARHNDNIHWLGHIRNDSELFSLWANAGVYFHGHSVGGTNPALVQAMACGSAIIARDTPYNREVLEDGALYTEPTPEGIANTILQVMRNDTLRTELSTKSLRRQKNEYTWNSVCADYNDALRRAVKASRVQPTR
ncbi:glycosyltransferase [Gordonia sp. DT219]|uniref:glycosyltransferase n=1 Tax=Gordonia sp. DT219 TaxID=3416658 RepID=UPI003CEBD241